VLIDASTSMARVLTQVTGSDHVCYFLETKPTIKDVIEPKTPLTLGQDVSVWRLADGDTFSVKLWLAETGESYLVRFRTFPVQFNLICF